MKYGSVKEYFIRLNTLTYQLMMLPLIFMIIYYSQSITGIKIPTLIPVDLHLPLFIVSSMVIASIILIMNFVATTKARKIANEVSLGVRLDLLGDVLQSKVKSLAMVTFICPVMIILTSDMNYSIVFGVLFIWYIVQWPSARKVVNMLKLKGDEKTLVLSKGEAFK